MSPIDLLWLFITFTSPQPVSRQRLVQASVEFIPQPCGPHERHAGGQPASSAGDR
jgi:hypothetical protein